ncbi:hypothetical protein GOP47_0025616 [Adiantum capillus-veneris]|uniref:DUF641 domain-containing protein n=1 Tax=Adiantum capillus-veneris TaxID=13818 RepID=A0A9D4U107_ADICA|nr:hypothetical protein GOP47_0025616 [Adiantum capillus-veneris]
MPHAPDRITVGKMQTSSQPSSSNGSSHAHGAGYLRKVARSYRTRLANGKNGGKSAQKIVASSEDPGINSDNAASDGSSGIASASMDAENTDAESSKSQSSLTYDPTEISLKVQVMETLITNVFSTISSLKSAYMQLQSAHVPYDPDKIQIADKAVISELKRLSELKHTYRERLAIVSSGQGDDEPALSTEGEGEKKSEILKSYEGIISNFHNEIQKKNSVVENLKDMLAQTTLKKEKLERRVKRLEQKLTKDPLANSPADLLPTPQLLEYVVLGASEASRSFTKLLTSLMKVAHWDLDAAANSIEPGITYARRTHKKFAFESYVNHRMLSGFESENFFVSSSLSTVLDPEKNSQECFKEFQELRSADPLEVITNNPQGKFAKYCLKRFLDVVHPKMEESFFGNIEHRKQVLAGIHPKSQFYQNFLKLAKAMWILHRLAFSFEPNARIFQVQRDAEFSPLYMESIAQLGESDVLLATLAALYRSLLYKFVKDAYRYSVFGHGYWLHTKRRANSLLDWVV